MAEGMNDNTIILYLKRGYVLFDEEDFDLIAQYKWSINNKGYVVTYIRDEGNYKSALFMHRLILGLTDRRELCDHKNHKTTDNRRCNIRQATYLENTRNKQSKKGSSSKYLGVSYQVCTFTSKKTGKPMIYKYIKAKINYGGKLLHVGTFKTEREAALAYNEAASRYFGEFANLNIL